VQHQCDRCHGVDTVFGSKRREYEEPAPESTAELEPEAVPLLTQGVSRDGRSSAALQGRSCVECHQNVSTAPSDPARLVQGRELFGDTFDRYVEKTAARYCNMPSLASMERFRASWLRTFLEAPYDIRPNLAESMIRHNLSPLEVETLVAGWNAGPEQPAPPRPSEVQLARGAALFEQKSCGLCHLLGNRRFEVAQGWQFDQLQKVRLRALAPDLQHARHRLARGTLVAWIQNPRRVKPTAFMPKLNVSSDEASALADFITFADLGPPPPDAGTAAFVDETRTPSFEEVDAQVFQPLCRPCHGNPFLLEGDQGPGATGGFGFPGLGLSFANRADLAKGSLAPDGQRQSIFRAGESGAPVLLERLRARLAENERDTVPPGQDRLVDRRATRSSASRGMPLGLPALTAQQLSLVTRWVASGAGREQEGPP
jgi:mono/diheme cytochrome c family protein